MLVGFAFIKKDAASGVSAVDIEKFRGEIVRVIEFASDGGVLCVDRESTGIAMFDACDVKSSFECKQIGDYILPVGLNLLEEIAYMTKVTKRKGGYNRLLRHLVIACSLHSGKFNDSVLFSGDADAEKESICEEH